MFSGYCEIRGNDRGLFTRAGGDTSEQPVQVRLFRLISDRSNLYRLYLCAKIYNLIGFNV